MKQILLLIGMIFISNSVFAHGEDKSGPHGGFIRMPGAFHTELVLDGKNKLKVYLLDVEWKNPSVRRSKLEILYKGPSTAKANCAVKENYYSCSFPQSVDLTQKGELKVMAQREENKGAEASYSLPLKLEIVNDEHGTHH